MSGVKINWSIWEVPVGPESDAVKRRVFNAPMLDTLKQYERLRQEEMPHGLVVTDQAGDAVYACS